MRVTATTTIDERLHETRFRGIRSCDQCPWQATMTGDTAEEVERFLEAVGRAHVTDRHAPPKASG